MKHKFGKIAVIALGGSIVHPDRIDTAFLKRFNSFARRVTRGGMKLVVVVGGGKLARLVQDAAHAIVRVADEDKDWLGIHATRMNAHLLRTIFKDIADPVVLDERFKMKKLEHRITIASGWRPGWSTDYIAAQLAADFKAREFVIAGKPTFVYDKDPDVNKDAAPIRTLKWSEYRKLVPKKWTPGLNAPVDPVAAALGQKEGIAAIVVDGRNLENFGSLLRGQEFDGSVIG